MRFIKAFKPFEVPKRVLFSRELELLKIDDLSTPKPEFLAVSLFHYATAGASNL